jgi:hypothetical protein
MEFNKLSETDGLIRRIPLASMAKKIKTLLGRLLRIFNQKRR